MEEPLNNPSPDNDEVHILDYLIVLAKHSRMIIFTTVAVTVLAYLVLFISPNIYIATARLLPPQQNMTMTAQFLDFVGGGVKPGGAGGLGGLAGGILGLKSPGDLYAAMMTCSTISDRIIERFQLRKLYNKRYLEDARKTLSKKAKIIGGRKDGLIIIEVTDKSAERAAEMANAFVEELDKLLQSLAVQEATGRLAFLEKEHAAANTKLAKAEEALRGFSEQNSVIQIDAQTRGMLQYIAQLRAEIDAKEVQVQVLRQQATPYNYDVVRLETQVKGLKEKLQTTEKQWDQSCIGNVCLTTSKVPTLGLEYIRLYREVKYQETLYQLYTKMVEIARLDMVKNVSMVQVLDQALVPEKRSNKRLLPAMVTGMVVFFLMILFAFGKEYWAASGSREDNRERLAAIK